MSIRSTLIFAGAAALALFVSELSIVADDAEVLGIAAKAEPSVVAFGDELRILVTLTNKGQEAVPIPPGKLKLHTSNWGAKGTGGTRGGPEDFSLVAEKRGDEVVNVAAGGAVTLVAHDRWITERGVFAVRADYILTASDEATRRLLPKDGKFSINFQVEPSELMRAYLTARTDQDRAKLRERTRELLKRRAAAKEWIERDYVEGTQKYVAGLMLPFLAEAASDPDPLVRGQAVEAYRLSAWAVANMNAWLKNFDREGKRPDWATGREVGDAKAATLACVRVAIDALKDPDAGVRLAGVRVLDGYPLRELSKEESRPAAEAVRKLATDPAADVRSAAQTFLAWFADAPEFAGTVAAGLKDADTTVRKRAIEALQKSPTAPPLPTLKSALQDARGEAALPLLGLLFEQENAELPATLRPGFEDRTDSERLAILTLIAGHTDAASLELTKFGLGDRSLDVQRAALLRLLGFPKESALPLVEAYLDDDLAKLRPVARSVRAELQQRRLFPFAGDPADARQAERELVFPSQNGTSPIVSPDGKWIAYVETGWGRPGGSGGMGGSNMIRIVHAVRSDGTEDRVISDMFLAGWHEDSRRIASVDSGVATICDLDGQPVAEFGEPAPQVRNPFAENLADWRQGELRHQLGAHMPHRKHLWAFASERTDNGRDSNESGLHAAFSPDGKLFGPLRDGDRIAFFGLEGDRIDVKVPAGFRIGGRPVTWSPTGRHVVLMPGQWTPGAVVIDMEMRDSRAVDSVETPATYGSWEYRRCRWNPWTRDGSSFAFVRNGQVWISQADGGGTRQVTFDSLAKVFPTFSPSGKRISYVTWQPDNRRHYTRPGPTDLWIVDIDTTLAARATAPATGRIHCLDWLDDDTLIFDRLEPKERIGYKSSLRKLSLKSLDEAE